MPEIKCEQRSPEWYSARLGRVTASRIADIMAKTKTGPSASRKNYAAELVCERLTGQPSEAYTNQAMQRGIELESEARKAFEDYMFLAVADAGFFTAPGIDMAGASPDGLISDDGLIEIKCPNTSTHIDNLINGIDKIDKKYIYQMQWQMFCAERDYCYFVSYDNRLPEHLQLCIYKIERDEKIIAEIKQEVIIFLDEVDQIVNSLNNLNKENEG